MSEGVIPRRYFNHTNIKCVYVLNTIIKKKKKWTHAFLHEGHNTVPTLPQQL